MYRNGYFTTSHTTTVLRPFFRDHPGEPVPEENFWTLWCKGRLTEADTLTIRLGASQSGLTSAHLHHHPHTFLQAGCPSCRPTNSVKAMKAETAILASIYCAGSLLPDIISINDSVYPVNSCFAQIFDRTIIVLSAIIFP